MWVRATDDLSRRLSYLPHLWERNRMKFDQFAFWLQGFFEITDHFSEKTLAQAKTRKDQFITAHQVECIKNHIQLHFECCLREDTRPNQFICWLDGSLTYFDYLPQPQQEALVLEIRKRLNSLFEHVIDPQMPGDKKSLQDIHDGKGGKKPAPKKVTGRGKALEFRPGSRRDGRDRRLTC